MRFVFWTVTFFVAGIMYNVPGLLLWTLVFAFWRFFTQPKEIKDPTLKELRDEDDERLIEERTRIHNTIGVDRDLFNDPEVLSLTLIPK